MRRLSNDGGQSWPAFRVGLPQQDCFDFAFRHALDLRGPRQTKLTEEFPAHVEYAWIGNSEAVADRHYLHMTEAHFDKAIRPPLALHLRSTKSAHETPNRDFARATTPRFPRPSQHPLLEVAEAGLEPARGYPPTGF